MTPLSRRDFIRRGSLYVASAAIVASGVDALADPERAGWVRRLFPAWGGYRTWTPTTEGEFQYAIRHARDGDVVLVRQQIQLQGRIALWPGLMSGVTITGSPHVGRQYLGRADGTVRIIENHIGIDPFFIGPLKGGTFPVRTMGTLKL